jgi:hypothetical protein
MRARMAAGIAVARENRAVDREGFGEHDGRGA